LAGPGHYQVELALVHAIDRRVYHQLVVQQPDSDRSDRTLEGNWRDRQRQRGAVDRQGGWIRFLVDGEDRRHDLDVVAEILGKQWPDRPVDQTAVENGLLAGPSLAPDEPAGDLTGGVQLLFVITGQREKVDSLPWGSCHRRRDEQHGVAHADGDGARCLLGNAAGLDRQRTPTDFDLCLIHDSSWAALKRPRKWLAVGPGGSSLRG